MFSRLKGAIDSRIAEEQARQRQQATSATPPRPTQRRRPLDQNGIGSRTSSRQREQKTSADRGPDPSEFEPEFAIGDDESAAPSRTGTPQPPPEHSTAASTADSVKEEKEIRVDDGEGKPADANGNPLVQARSLELPSEVQTKLRKLDRLETKYGELLKAYRIAHTRIQVIEPFEVSLREHTPLANINDPAAFVEYLGQLNAKSDMVLDEFKRVSAERDEIKKKADQSEDTASQLRVEISELKKHITPEVPAIQAIDEAAGQSEVEAAPATDEAREPTSPVSSIKSPASTSSRIPSFSLFSPRSKPMSSPPKEPEDLFSFDSEVPKLESELQQKQQEVESLKNQMEKLKRDLVVARESTEGMVVSLESATRELHELRDAHDKFEEIKGSLEERIRVLESAPRPEPEETHQLDDEVKRLRQEKSDISQQLEESRQQVNSLQQSNSDLQTKLESNRLENQLINEKLGQKDSVVKDLEDTLAMMKSAERQAGKAKSRDESSEKKLNAMQEIMDTLRGQLNQAEATVKELRQEIQTNQDKFESRPSTKVFGFLDGTSPSNFPDLQTRDDAVDYLATNFGLQKVIPTTTQPIHQAPSVAPSEASTTQTAKKKNKKKKKGKTGQVGTEELEVEGPVKVSENLAEVGEVEAAPDTADTAVQVLEGIVSSLRSEIGTKDTSIDRLSKQVKEQEALQEEIETLRDDLLHQGEGHVEARDKLKAVETERADLSARLNQVENELQSSKKKLAEGSSSNETLQKTLQELEDVKNKSAALQIDLNASEQVAASRFKDVSELKDVLAKAQPELKSLRAEVAEFKAVKEELKNKIGELKRLESRYEDLKSEMKGLSKRLGDKDAEIKELQQKIEQETSNRTKMEEELRISQSDLRVAETKKNDAVSTSNELSQEVKKAKQEVSSLRGRVSELEDAASSHGRQVAELKEEISLKTALHSSSQGLVQSLRDQTHELTTQAREATSRAENLEEEVAEAQRMLTERTREGQTMRMLLNQSESGTEARVREMRERMDAAIEERDRIEDEASVSSRRMMRELDDAKNREREARRGLKIAEDEKEEVEIKMRDFRRKREDLESSAESARKELDDVRTAMIGLRDALNESERQVREQEVARQDLRKVADEAKERVDKLTKANKNLSDEVKGLQAAGVPKRRPGIESGVQSSRTSIDSSRTRSPAPPAQHAQGLSSFSSQRPTSRSETPTTTNPATAAAAAGTGLSQGAVDYVYLKNVLLQFLEQKDKQHQRQLVPVIGMLLHFDRKDEQKWMSAISTR